MKRRPHKPRKRGDSNRVVTMGRFFISDEEMLAAIHGPILEHLVPKFTDGRLPPYFVLGEHLEGDADLRLHFIAITDLENWTDPDYRRTYAEKIGEQCCERDIKLILALVACTITMPDQKTEYAAFLGRSLDHRSVIVINEIVKTGDAFVLRPHIQHFDDRSNPEEPLPTDLLDAIVERFLFARNKKKGSPHAAGAEPPPPDPLP